MSITKLCEKWLLSGDFTDTVSFWKTSLYDMVLILDGIHSKYLNDIQLQNMYNGNLLATIMNTSMLKKKGSKVYGWTDFYKDIFNSNKRDGKPMSSEDISNKLHKMFGGSA